jgi:hypothetical protein
VDLALIEQPGKTKGKRRKSLFEIFLTVLTKDPKAKFMPRKDCGNLRRKCYNGHWPGSPGNVFGKISKTVREARLFICLHLYIFPTWPRNSSDVIITRARLHGDGK